MFFSSGVNACFYKEADILQYEHSSILRKLRTFGLKDFSGDKERAGFARPVEAMSFVASTYLIALLCFYNVAICTI